MDITNRILKTENVKWKELLPIQGKNFKELNEASYLKLKHSIKANSFIAPFAVWQAKDGKIYTLDGVHRCRVLLDLENEGVVIPVTLPANFIDAKDRKEAAKLLLVYSSAYAKVTDEGLYEFLNIEGLDFDELKLEIDISDLDLDKFEDGYMKNENTTEKGLELNRVFNVVIDCKDETEQQEQYEKLTGMGIVCRVLTL